MTDNTQPQVFTNRWANSVGPNTDTSPQDFCTCVPGNRTRGRAAHVPHFHRELQDITAPGWLRLLELVDEAAEDGREEFRPLVELTAEQRRQIVTLPASIAKLTAVKHLDLYRSNLVRIPPEIGMMRSLEEFTPYTSYRLHWFPYEITRCPALRRSTVSTRALYGNYKVRSPFPALPAPGDAAADLPGTDPAVRGATEIRSCSVCDGPVDGTALRQVWISLRTSGADVLPLLVNACSAACVDALPTPTDGYIQEPHTGGPGVVQPPRR
ncbi:leucine-rich repeat domain-containing protein [Uniformispora flossi]|uniref:leucine-rich repeat domain-containing protein n=1 Tax=Uniformispora flossi TaxID=3390723 RepID=UPI003C2B5682